MCGLTGWFSADPITRGDEPRLKAMLQAVAHRGPDGSGTRLCSHAALGHCRLAIIDLAGGVQPMTSADRQTSIVFNGEIYNYKELRERLISRGVMFVTESDTEVLLHLYRDEGRQGFARLRGMYAFALWDEREKTGLLVRDPLGIKPLFYAETGQRQVYFASEAKALVTPGLLTPSLDPASLHLLMNFRYLPGDRTLFYGIRQLAPGQILEWTPDKTTTRLIPPLYPQRTADNLIDVLRDSVHHHLVSDVEVGCYLSGGIDSAAITYLANHESRNPPRTFTLDLGDDPSEARHAARSAALLGNSNYLGAQTDAIEAHLPRLIWHLEVPKINALQVYLLARHARQYVKVALSGLGGDELFLGYNAHRIMHLGALAGRWTPTLIGRALGGAASRIARWSSCYTWGETERGFDMLGALGNWPRYYGILRNIWDSPDLRKQIYGPRMLDEALPNAHEVLEEMWPSNPDPVMAMAEFEWKNKMVNDLLWQEDRASMAVGLEVRVPLVDLHLAHHVQALDRNTLMPRGRPKGYLRENLRQYLPREILNRPKSGFQVNSAEFFHQHLAKWNDTLLSTSHILDTGLFNPAFIKAVQRYPIARSTRWHYFMLYLILGTHLWSEIFEERKWPTA